MATSDMVSETPVNDGSRSSESSSSEGSDPESRQDSTSSGDPEGTEADSMAPYVRAYKTAGLSESAAALAGEARRASTRKTYNVRIRKYRKWCKRKQVDPYKASVGDVADFFTEVFKDGGSVNSVRSCRSAVKAIHKGFPGGYTVSSSPLLQDLIKGMFHIRPPQRSLVPRWDLPRALQLLAKPPFEPMNRASTADIARKTAFLIATASGRRVSDIQALSTADNHISFTKDAVHLLPRAGYLAKNQSLSFTPKHIILPDLRKASGSADEGPWCPLRALRYYLDRTQPYRLKEDHLFLTVQKPFRAASKQTISRWIVSVIKESISSEELQLSGTHIRAHDLRSQASAWALYRGASLQDIIEAMAWSSSSTFQTTYLKDVLAGRAATATRVLTSASEARSSTTGGQK